MAKQSRKNWKSAYTFDPLARQIIVVGLNIQYHAFLQYMPKLTKEGILGETNGNVIRLHTEARRYIDSVLIGNELIVDLIDERAKRHNLAIWTSLFEHESQHVVQHYEMFPADPMYLANRLRWEKEACARQILHTSFKDAFAETNLHIREGILENMTNNGMTAKEAELWIADVESTGIYPGVNSPRSHISVTEK